MSRTPVEPGLRDGGPTAVRITSRTRGIAGQVRGSGRLFAFALLMSVVSGVSAVVLMASSGWLLSRAAEHPPVLHLQVVIVIVRACGLARGLARYVERLIGHDLALKLQSSLRIDTYRSLARTTLLGRRRGDVLVRIVDDVAAIQDLLVRVALPFASAAIVTAATVLALGLMSPTAAIALLTSAIIAGGFVPWLAKRISGSTDRLAAPARGDLASQLTEISGGATDLAAYGDTGRLDALQETDRRIRAIEERAAVAAGLASMLQLLAAGAAVLVALWVGIPLVASGELARVNLAVLVLTPLALHDVLSTLNQTGQTLTRVQVSLDRIGSVLDAEPVGSGDRSANDPATGTGALELDGATLGWPGHRPVLTDVSLRVAPGERVGLAGPSGVGKTTVAATLLGMIEPRAGRASGGDSIGYLAQDAHVFNTSVRENVRVGSPKATDAQITEALARAGLALDLDRIVGEDGSRLSGGEARRLALTRLLVSGHRGWILDEPTEHLDSDTARQLTSDLLALAPEGPMLVISHDEELLAACDRVVRLG